MDKVNQPLLSICIPTYNRADILSKTLIKMLEIVGNCDYVEFVISDNCSSDNTGNVIKDLQLRYNNIKYFRNASNVRDYNFYLVLFHAKGVYLKLLNDYTYLDQLGFQQIIENIKKYEGSASNLLFYDHLRNPNTNENEVSLTSVNNFVRFVNNKITWISNFGIWKWQFNKLLNSEYIYSTQLSQMYWTLNLIVQNPTIICNFKHYHTIDVGKKRVAYNFFIPQVANYYNLLYSYRDKGLIDDSTILFDKKRLLTDFVGAKILDYLFLDKNQVFDLKGSWEILDKYFSDCPYYYKLKRKGKLLRFLKNIHCLKMYGIFCRIRSLFKKL